jgi:hypothetical protein
MKIIKEENQNALQERNIVNILKKMQDFSYREDTFEKNNDSVLKYAHDLIKKFKEYNTEYAKKYTTDRRIPVRDTIEKFATSLKIIFPEKYNSEFNPIFSKAGITPKMGDLEKQEKPSETSTKTEEIPKVEEKPKTGETPKTEEKSKAEETPKVEETPKPSKEEYVKGYTGVSIIDFLNQSGKPSDKEARRKLAVELGIVNKPEDYKGTADQNTRLLNALRGGKVTSDDGVEVGKAELAKPYTKPKEGKGPTIKYGRMEYPAYVDMGGGKYRPAYQEELDNPNIQLYIPNPKKGAAEYNKPNFVKVRREGSDIRPQSQFGGAAGSLSNFFGDIGRTLAGK